MGLEGVGVNAGEQAAGAVAETFVEVGVEIVGYEEIFVEKVACGLVDYEFLVEAVAVAGVVVGLGDVLDSHGFGAVGGAYPVGVGQVDADGGRGIGVAGENGGVDYLGAHALDHGLAETRVDGRAVLEPLRVGRNRLRALRGSLVLIVDD